MALLARPDYLVAYLYQQTALMLADHWQHHSTASNEVTATAR